MNMSEQLRAVAENFDADDIAGILDLTPEDVVYAFKGKVLDSMDAFFPEGFEIEMGGDDV